MSDIKVRHYRRAHAHAQDKELVTEVVQPDSDTGQFLRRMEVKRLSRPCFMALDMRGKVPGECRKYILNNRAFYLDDTSYDLYQRGVQEAGGVFTVGTYEAVVNGAHTNKAMREAREAEERQRRGELRETGRQAALRTAGREAGREPPTVGGAAAGRRDDPRYMPEILPLGYYKKRNEERLQYVCALEVQINGATHAATTRDISPGGLQVALKGLHRIPAGARVMVALTGLKEDAGALDLSALAYQVVSGVQKDDVHLLCLCLVEAEAPAGFADFVRDLITRYRRRYKLDAEDDLWSVSAWLYERLYTESLVQIPFFVGRDGNGNWYVQAVAVTDGNQPFSQFFRNDVDSYDFSPLCLSGRLQYLHDHQEMLLAMYREKEGNEYRIHSAADGEFPDAAARDRFLRFALVHEEHCVVKLTVAGIPARRPNGRKIDMLTGRLLEKSERDAVALRDEVGDLLLVGMAIDITGQVRDVLGDVATGYQPGQDLAGLACWVGGVRRGLVDGAELERVQEQGHLQPSVVRFGYVERRREDRFLAETAVQLLVGGKRFDATTRDISTRGLCVRSEMDLDIAPGAELGVAFVKLQERRPSLDLMNVGYRLVGRRSGPINSYMLERLPGGRHQEINEFFVELITKNRHKLTLDVDDAWSAAASRLYESMVAENLPTVPFFIARSEDGGPVIQWVAMSEGSASLAAFFADGAGGYDFRWLTAPSILTPVYSRIAAMTRAGDGESQRPAPCELEVWVYRSGAADGAPAPVQAATELELAGDPAVAAALAAARAQGAARRLKLMATYTLEPDRRETDAAIEQLREHSRHRAFKLQEQLQSVVAYGELVDITEPLAGLLNSAE